MSRDQKPGKVRHVGVTQDRRHGEGAAVPPPAAGASAIATPGALAAPPAKRGGIGLVPILMFLMFAGIGGGSIVALAPSLGLWP